MSQQCIQQMTTPVTSHGLYDKTSRYTDFQYIIFLNCVYITVSIESHLRISSSGDSDFNESSSRHWEALESENTLRYLEKKQNYCHNCLR